MSAPEQVQVTQADRDAAVGILRLSLSNSDERAMMIAEGSLDLDPVVQAFARHRHTAQSDTLAVMREAADGIGKWLSAALDDPAVCDAMKADINAWFAAIDQMGGG
jgi:hypothetical protein